MASNFLKKLLLPFKSEKKKELYHLRNMPRFTPAITNYLGIPFKFHDNLSFLTVYEEVFKQENYKFAMERQQPYYIIDCGSNIGMSIFYFKQNYPKWNVESWNTSQIEIFNKAVWKEETVLKFEPEGTLAGKISNDENNNTKEIPAVPLLPFVENRKVDFLKIDIEGAELEVLKSIVPAIKNISKLFIEYHSLAGKPQHLDIILNILSTNGFKYHIKDVNPIHHPLIEKRNEGFDLQLDIYAINENLDGGK